MNVLMLSTYDRAGGAERVAYDLCRAYRRLGHDARMFVRYRRSNDALVYEIDAYADTSAWAFVCRFLEAQVRRCPDFRGRYRVLEYLRRVAWPGRGADVWRGVDNFRNPSTHRLSGSLPDWQPEVIHAHNLHGGYFDLSALPALSRSLPFVWTLHDTWAFTGHCAYFMECERWRSGCGHCPDLKRQPAIRQDACAENWGTKRWIYAQSRLAIAAPSRWLMSHVEDSILKDQEKEVIPNGVDLFIFKSGDKQAARRALGLPADAFICLYVAFSGAQVNPYKDYTTIARAVEQLRAADPGIFFICIGGLSQARRQSHSLHTGFIDDPETMALHYQAADVLLHAANAENFPCAILEAMACDTVVVATAVGGILEQIEDGKTGFLVRKKDAEGMRCAVLALRQNPALRQQVVQEASRLVQKHYRLEQQTSRYLDWFHKLVKSYHHAGF